MNDCKRVRSLIEEAERPGLISYEAEGHLSDCASCREFARERTSLREMLSNSARVALPVNYDAMLRAKLDEAREAKTFSWLSPAGYLQMGAATAGIIIAVVAAQYSGMFSSVEQPAKDTLSKDAVIEKLPVPRNPAPMEREESQTLEAQITELAQPVRKSARGRTVSSSARAREMADVDPSFVILMGQDGETRVSVPTVGVGAQPILMSSSHPSASAVRTSF